MAVVSHLKALQALELAVRVGSLTAAAKLLGITPAAVGQRVRALEDHLGTDLLVHARSGLKPTAKLEQALGDLKTAFEALGQAYETLDFQRVAEIHIVADPDWAELWLGPRLGAFRTANPNILFCINGAGDVPLRLGAPDCRIEYAEPERGEVLFHDLLLPLSGSDNVRRIASPGSGKSLEGMPFLHLEAQRDDPARPGWRAWVERFGHRQEGAGRGVHYRHARLALDAVRQDVGFLVCGLSLVTDDLTSGKIVLPFPAQHCLVAPRPYILRIATHGTIRPQLQRFCDWLRSEAAATRRSLHAVTAQAERE